MFKTLIQCLVTNIYATNVMRQIEFPEYKL